MTVAELSPDTFTKIYDDVWIKMHEQEAAADNPNPEETVDQVKIGTQISNEPGTTNQADTGANDSGNDATSSGSGRKLASVTTRLVSAVLPMFGIRKKKKLHLFLSSVWECFVILI